MRVDSLVNRTAADQAENGGVIPTSTLHNFWTTSSAVSGFLRANHYLGPVTRGFAWRDEWGVVVLAKPTSRRLPQDGTWLELVRWCLLGEKNGGSRQWSRILRALRKDYPGVTTIVSYSDPSQGHTGALYRSCNWLWAPTWHRLRPPPTGNGNWGKDKIQSVKDRWVCTVRKDARRSSILPVKDPSVVKRCVREGITLINWSAT